MRILILLGSLLTALGLTGCVSGPVPSDRLGARTELSLETFFEGRTYAYGVFERGNVLDRRLWVEIDGNWDNASQTLTLDEHFIYDDGETQRRTWTMRRVAPNRFVATAPDVNGDVDLQTFGDAGFFNYLVDLQLSDGSSVEVRFEDRLYQMSERVMLNRATVSKFGLTLGEVAFVFLKDRPADWPDVPRSN